MTEISKEYGTALFMLACEENAKKEYAEALEKLKTAFLENPDYEMLLASPGIPLEERLSVIQTAFGGAVPEHVLSYLQLLCEKGRICCFMESIEEYKRLLDASEHISDVKVTSAVELTDDEKQKLTNKLKVIYKGEVNAEYFIDETLLGGLIVESEGKVMDGSLRHRLREVKEVMSV